MIYADIIEQMDGEVKHQFIIKWGKYISIVMLFFIILPAALFFLPLGKSDFFSVVTFIWTAWTFLGIYIMSNFEDYINEKVLILSILPIFIPVTIYVYVVYYFLKKKYPNTEDPDGILKFERKRKIKNIL